MSVAVCRSGSSTVWSSYNLPTRVEYTSTNTYADFSYGPNRERVRTTEHDGSGVGRVPGGAAYSGEAGSPFWSKAAIIPVDAGPILVSVNLIHLWPGQHACGALKWRRGRGLRGARLPSKHRRPRPQETPLTHTRMRT